MSKKTGIVFISMGVVLILSALLIFLYNSYEDYNAGRQSENLLEQLQAAIPKDEQSIVTAGTPVTKHDSEEGETSKQEVTGEIPESQPADVQEETTELTVVELGDYGYVGYVSIPAIEIELPVMSEWDYKRLKKAPCRQFGSSKTDDLVIAAHNYKNHFGYLSELEIDDTVTFTDMDGQVNLYSVAEVRTIDPTDVEVVQDSGYDLVLYTCTPGGANRVAVFCNRVEEIPFSITYVE